MNENQKCVVCGKPATKNILIHDPCTKKSLIPVCADYPNCAITSTNSKNQE